MENTRNQDGIGAKELLVVSFGTSFPDSRIKTIGAIEDAMEHAFPNYSVRRAFTSGMILRAVARKEGVTIDSISAALERARQNGVQDLIVQPTTMMNGFEYEKLMNLINANKDAFSSVRVGSPLLTEDADYAALIDAITAATREYDDGQTAIVFMGHGTEAASNGVYSRLQTQLAASGHSRYFIGTVEATPTLDDVMASLPAGCTRVVLEPLMIVAGDHANNDMAGDEPDSWKSILESKGYTVTCILRGLGELEAVHRILIRHAETAKSI